MAQSSNRTNVYPVQEELRSSEAIRRKKGDIAMESSLIHPNNKYAAPTLHACEEGMKTKLIPALLGAKQTRQQATEESQVLLLWNNSVTEHNPHLCVHDLFCKQAAQTPHAKAVRWANGFLTYADLERQSTKLASQLREQGVKPQEPVGLFLDRSVEAIVGMLAILKAGGAYLPLDPSYPADRLAYMLQDAQPKIVLTHSRLKSRLPQSATTVLFMDRLPRSSNDQHGKHSTAPKGNPDHLAYIIYTSGSTGRPKGVMVGHRGLTNLALAQIDEFRIRADDRVLQVASLNFDASVSEVWMTLLAGACLCMTPADSLLAGTELEQLLVDQSITAVTLTPSVLASLRPLPFAGLRTLIVAGEACPAELARQWSKGRRFYNAYGPTEVTVCATIAHCDSVNGKPPIGKAIANTQAFLLDSKMRKVPVGTPGELYVGGIGLAWGYLNRPNLTADRFVPNPFSDAPGARLYKTGDLCCQLPDGNLDFLGRVDHQVKIRGIRIELGEIEAAIAVHPEVRSCVVVTREDAQGKDKLVAYIVPPKTRSLTTNDLRQFLKQSLPEYALPSTFVFLDSLPLSLSGKVDRSALPTPNWVRDEQSEYVAPRTILEQFLAKTWSEVLGVNQIGVRDNFFELGGSSIQVVILAQKIQDQLGEYVYTVALFDAPTIEQLAIYLRQHYPNATSRVFGVDLLDGCISQSTDPLTADRVARFQEIVRILPPRTNDRPRRKNPPAVFVLSPQRSGSTLLRVMLAGHPKLFAPPELQLLNFNTMAERNQAFASERDRFWLNGTIRAIMEIQGVDAPGAEKFIADCERNGMTVQEFYRLMQIGLGNRILVDKTPNYALDPAMLERAENDFQDAKYIHLVRQPGAMVSSFEEAKLHVFFPPFLTSAHRGTPRQLAELVWLLSHQNIQDFLKKIPAERQHRVTFEDMVRDPKHAMQEVSRFLSLEFHPDMVNPHKDKKTRMTDPHHPQARMLGDVKFHEHKGIDAKAAERFRQRDCEEPLAAFTIQRARSMGYDLPAPDAKLATAPTGEQSAQPRRARRSALVRIQARENGTPIFCIHPAGGTVMCYRDFAKHLGSDYSIYGLQGIGAHGKHFGHKSIEAMAAHYIKEIRTVQPEGPYNLVGWSLGGVVAYEMAQQLRKKKHPIAFLGLVDSDLPRQRRTRSLATRRFLLDFAHQCGLEVSPEVLQNLETEEQLTFLLERAKGGKLIPADLSLERFRQVFERNARIFRANVRALRRYEPQPYSERVVLFQAIDRIGRSLSDQEGTWHALAENVEVHEVLGNHYTIICEPHVRNLTDQIRQYLPRQA